MPKIEGYDRQVGLGAGPTAARIDPGMFAGNSAAMAHLSEAIGSFAAGQERVRQRNAHLWAAKSLAQTQFEWTQHLDKRQDESPEGAPDFTKGVMKDFDEYANNLLNSAPDQETRDALEARLTDYKGHLFSRAASFEHSAAAEKQRRDLHDMVDMSANTVRSDDRLFQSAYDNVVSAIDRYEGADDALKREAHAYAGRRLAVAAVEGRIKLDPEAARRDLNGGSLDHLLRPEDKDHLLRGVDTEVRAREAEADRRAREAEKAQEEQRQRWLSDLTLKVKRGGASVADIETAYNGGKGWLKPHERTTLELFQDERDRRDTAALDTMRRVSAALGGNGPALDHRSKDDRDALALHFASVAAGWQGRPSAEVNDRIVSYSQAAGMVPDPVKAQLRGSLRAGSPEQRIAAANLLEGLRKANPDLLNDFAREDIAVANLIGTYSSYGVPPAEAARLADEGRRVDDSERRVREDGYRKGAQDTPSASANYLRDQLQGGAFARWLVPGVTNATPPAEMVHDFDRLAEAEYVRLGNMDAARKTALDGVRRVWGVTQVGGMAPDGSEGPRFMRYAPEMFYGRPGWDAERNGEWIRQQLMDDLRKSGGMFDDGAGKLERRFMLAADPGRSDPATGGPLYTVLLKGRDGTINAVRGSDGKPLAWRPDWTTSAAASREADAVAAAKAEHAARKVPALLQPGETP
ncbi:MAG TPA: hypothetical protein VK196_06495 [Magnetospirillum sp.]|nr:hypothetical protein [Magnetospirillum sp.]